MVISTSGGRFSTVPEVQYIPEGRGAQRALQSPPSQEISPFATKADGTSKIFLEFLSGLHSPGDVKRETATSVVQSHTRKVETCDS